VSDLTAEGMSDSQWAGQSRYNLLPPDELALADALLSVADQVGEFDLADNIWVGYEDETENEDASIGVRCGNCAMQQTESSCRLLLQTIHPDGKCRFAIIPPGEVDV
jgi:hypothetical protein